MYLFNLFHAFSKKKLAEIRPFAPTSEWPEEWKTAVVKTYERFPLFALPEPHTELGTDLGRVIRTRRTRRVFKSTLDESILSDLLFHSMGKMVSADGESEYRVFPSAGSLYPLEGYLVLFTSVRSLPPGVYHYDVPTNGMRLIDRVHPDPAQAVAATAQPTVANAKGCIVLTATFSRSAPKYGERAYKHAFLEAGSVMQNIGLVGEALHIDTMSVGVCADEYLEPLLGIDGTDEVVLHTIFFG